MQHPPFLRDPSETILSDHSALDSILETPPGLDAHLDTAMDDVGARSAYEKAIAYICSVKRALDQNEPEFRYVGDREASRCGCNLYLLRS